MMETEKPPPRFGSFGFLFSAGFFGASNCLTSFIFNNKKNGAGIFV